MGPRSELLLDRPRARPPAVGLWLLAVGLLVLLVHAKSPVVTSSDSRWFVPVALSLIHEGDVDLDEFAARIEADRDYAIRRVDGHAYNLFPIGTALVALPLVWLLEQVIRETTGVAFLAASIARPQEAAEQLIASVVVALAAMLIFLLAYQHLASLRWALLPTAVFAFASPAWSTASRALWQHGPSMLLLSAALLALDRAARRPRWALVAGPLLAFAWLIRPTNAIPLVALLVALAWTDRRRAVASGALGLLVLAPFFLHNLTLFGTWLPPYFRASRLTVGSTFLEALAGNLVSPSRGLLVFSPIFVLAALGIGLAWRRRVFGPVGVAAVVTIGAHWVAVSAFPHWWGGFSVGPRLMSDLTPFFVYLLLPVVTHLATPGAAGRRALGLVLALLLAVSLLINGRCALRPSVPAWNSQPVSVDEHPERVWDWRDPQFQR